MTLQYPNMREELIGLLADLAASEHLSDEWIAFPDYGFGEWFNLVDDVLPEGAEAAAGVVLNPNEVEPVADFERKSSLNRSAAGIERAGVTRCLRPVRISRSADPT
jgi:hypothetical protein